LHSCSRSILLALWLVRHVFLVLWGFEGSSHELGWHELGWHELGWHELGWHELGWQAADERGCVLNCIGVATTMAVFVISIHLLIDAVN
jgi:hypothetical protein